MLIKLQKFKQKGSKKLVFFSFPIVTLNPLTTSSNDTHVRKVCIPPKPRIEILIQIIIYIESFHKSKSFNVGQLLFSQKFFLTFCYGLWPKSIS